MTKHRTEAYALLAQKHQQSAAQKKLGEIKSGVETLNGLRDENLQTFEDLDAELDALLEGAGIEFDPDDSYVDAEIQSLLDSNHGARDTAKKISLLEIIELEDESNWSQYLASVESYAHRNDLDLTGDPFSALLTESQRIVIEKRIDEDLTYKNAQCDKYDYMLAGTCGLIAGLVDILFVGIPGKGKIGQATDEVMDGAIVNTAKMLGWSGPREGSDPKASAIGYLERNFKVNYDQTHGNAPGSKGTGGKVKHLTPTNHHVKNLGHSPDLIGLLFSIINQFNNTSTFVDDGRLITIDTDSFELRGNNFPAKVFSGFCNWLGHLASDMGGSSGSSGRGTGIPMPFYSMLQFLNFGSFGQHKDTFAKVAVKVFEQGYDLRHGMALAIPVVIAELLTRMAWSFKQNLYHGKDWSDCIPVGANPELRRMLLVAHGSLCMVDGVDAGLRSGGNMVQFMLRANLLAWARFGFLAIKETRAWYATGSLDIDAANDQLDREYQLLLSLDRPAC